MSADERMLLTYIVWNVRVGDLPDDIRDAAGRVAATRRYPRPDDADQFAALTTRVSVFPNHDDEVAPLELHTAAPGVAVDRFIGEHPDFYAILIQRAAEPTR